MKLRRLYCTQDTLIMIPFPLLSQVCRCMYTHCTAAALDSSKQLLSQCKHDLVAKPVECAAYLQSATVTKREVDAIKQRRRQMAHEAEVATLLTVGGKWEGRYQRPLVCSRRVPNLFVIVKKI